MAVTVTKRYDSDDSSTGKNTSLTETYVITEAADRVAALNALLTATPTATIDGYIRQTARVSPIGDPDETEIWQGEVIYGEASFSAPQTGDSIFNFDTTGGQQHITQSLATVASYPGGSGAAPDFEGAIGYDGEQVQGAEITVPVYSFSETHWLAAATVDITYRGKIFALTGKVNNASFKGTQAGECLFLGASGSRRGTDASDGWEITYRFAAQPNQTGLTIGDITGITKKGWEYLWVLYADVIDNDTAVLVKRPRNVYIEKVYRDGDFSTLGIGT
jgi:hypothetical protein